MCESAGPLKQNQVVTVFMHRIPLLLFACGLGLLLGCSSRNNQSLNPSKANQAATPTPQTSGDLKATVAELLQHINDHPALGHSEDTPAVNRLAAIGRPALHYGALELLLSDDYDTRVHAEAVLYTVVSQEMGFAPATDSTNAAHRLELQDSQQKLFKRNGDYSPDAPPAERQASYEKWVKWLHDTDPAGVK